MSFEILVNLIFIVLSIFDLDLPETGSVPVSSHQRATLSMIPGSRPLSVELQSHQLVITSGE